MKVKQKLSQETMFVLNQLMKEIVSHNSKCKTCTFNHNGECYFSINCTCDDFSYYRRDCD